MKINLKKSDVGSSLYSLHVNHMAKSNQPRDIENRSMNQASLIFSFMPTPNRHTEKRPGANRQYLYLVPLAASLTLCITSEFED